MTGKLRLRFVALIAAYALALQALLSAFVMAVPATEAALTVICSGAAGDNPAGQPVGHDPISSCPASCVMSGCGTGFALARSGVDLHPARLDALRQPSVAALAAAPAAIRGPQVPRAPPSA